MNMLRPFRVFNRGFSLLVLLAFTGMPAPSFGAAETGRNKDRNASAPCLVPAGFTAIRSAEDLRRIELNLSGDYILCNSLNLSGVTFQPLGSNTDDGTFSGTFDGNGKTISNLSISATAADEVGLFARTDGATIRNLSLTGATVSGRSRVGILAGRSTSTSILDVHVDGAVSAVVAQVGGLVGRVLSVSTISGSSASAVVSGINIVGGLIGISIGVNSGSRVAIQSSYSDGTVNGREDVGGFIGTTSETLIADSYAAGTVSSVYYGGGFVGNFGYSEIFRSYSAVQVSGPSGSVFSFAGRLTSAGISQASALLQPGRQACGPSYHSSCGVALYSQAQASLRSAYPGWDMEYHDLPSQSLWIIAAPGGIDYPRFRWEHRAYEDRPEGCGQPVGSIPVREFADFLQMLSNRFADFYLCNDIDFSDLPQPYIPIGSPQFPFRGSFDGGGHTISGLTIEPSAGTTYAGLFGYAAAPARITNLRLENIYVVARAQLGVGAVLGGGEAVISNIEVSGVVEGGLDTGGIVGTDTYSVLTDVRMSGLVIGHGAVGGAIGAVIGSSITRVSSSATVVKVGDALFYSAPAGGLIGYVEPSGTSNLDYIVESFATGDVISADDEVGGLIGALSSYPQDPDSTPQLIRNCYASGNVTGHTQVGGLIGSATDFERIENSYSRGRVTGSAESTGGLIGVLSGQTTIRNSYWDVDTSAQSRSAGGSGRSHQQMTAFPPAPDTYTDWSFYDPASNPNGVWEFGDTASGYPELRR